jgi:nucleotide-binding universal stress UspA family protein
VIIVGVDHSPAARAALRFALAEAELRHTSLRAVHAWQLGYIGYSIEGFYPPIGAQLEDLRDGAKAALDATLQEAIPDAGGVEVDRRIIEGPPAAVLIAESQDAELLVVGSRGLGGFSGLLLGSVSQQCAHHAACPVVIVRPPAGTPEHGA